MCSGSKAGSYLRLVDFVYHSTLGLRVKYKKKKVRGLRFTLYGCGGAFKVLGFRAHDLGLGRRERTLRFRGGLVCKAHRLLYHSA